MLLLSLNMAFPSVLNKFMKGKDSQSNRCRNVRESSTCHIELMNIFLQVCETEEFNIHSFNKYVLSGYDRTGIGLNTGDPAGNKSDPWKHACPDISVCCLTWGGVGGSNQVLIWLQGKWGEFKCSIATCHAPCRSPFCASVVWKLH